MVSDAVVLCEIPAPKALAASALWRLPCGIPGRRVGGLILSPRRGHLPPAMVWKDRKSMPTISQLIRKPRQEKTYREKARHLGASPAEAGRLHARLYDDAEEAEFGVAESRQGAPDQWFRGDRLYPGRGP